jgi:hypothetical protein
MTPTAQRLPPPGWCDPDEEQTAVACRRCMFPLERCSCPEGPKGPRGAAGRPSVQTFTAEEALRLLGVGGAAA